MTNSQVLKSYFDADDAQVIKTFSQNSMTNLFEVLVTWNGRKNMIARRYRVVIRDEQVQSYKAL